MGTSGIPIGKMRRNMSILWKLLAIIVIIQASGINAKQIQNDLSFDDTFDIDQFDDVASAKLRSARDLDEQAFIEDELQPVDENDRATTPNDGSWLMQSVKRVRRELGRLFGSEEKKSGSAGLENHKKSGKTLKHHGAKHAKNTDLAKKRQTRSGGVITITKAKGANKRKVNKRQSYDNVGEGSGGGGDDEFADDDMDTWQTLFSINEPWLEDYRVRTSVAFLDLQTQLGTAFNDYAANAYPEEDDFISVHLLRVEPTSDNYKFHCIAQVGIPEKWNNFGAELRYHLQNMRRFGEFGADADSSFYFRRVRDIGDHESVDITTDYNENGEGIDNDGYPHGNGNEDHIYNADNIPFGECDMDGFFRCRNGQIIECAFRCDQKFDCEDNTDEDKDMCYKYIIEHEEEADETEDGEGEGEGDNDGTYNYGEVTDEAPSAEKEEEDYNYERDERERMERERELEIERQLQEEQIQRERQEQERLEQEQQERQRAEQERQREQQERERAEQERERAEQERQFAEQERERAEQERSHSQSHGSDTEPALHDCISNPDGEFLCDNGEVIPCYYRCDNEPHCSDHSDESAEECYATDIDSPTEATATEHDSGNHESHDVTFDESSGDYAPITETSPVYTGYESGCRGDTTFTCSNGLTICDYQRCDDIEQCPDGEDEMGCNGDGDDNDDHGVYETVCSENEFKCDNRCLPQEYQCNGVHECADLTDEANCPERERECSDSEFKCRSGDCIDASKRCNHYSDCPDGDDEDESCQDFVPEDPSECDIYEFECDYSSCIPIEKKCDGYPDCDDETDEIDCPPFTDNCSDNEFECDKNYCILSDQQCNGVLNCNDGADEKNCTFCREGAFLCNTGECVLENLHCNGRTDCADGSDEHNCECPPLFMRCNDTCVSWKLRCDGTVDCTFNTDELDCDDEFNNVKFIFTDTCGLGQWQCDNKDCINKTLLCNGRNDCMDKSDELSKHCIAAVATVLTPDDCKSNEFFCDDNCHPMSIRCNGEYDCADRSDEQDCSRTTRRPPTTYPCPQHTCPNGQCYSESQRCDGTSQCDDGSDEAHCCAADQFRCRNGDCVPGYAHCNGHRDCVDNSDEEECADPVPAYPSRCSSTQFRCDNGQCINDVARCNGYTDCADSSDERYCSNTVPDPQLNLKTYPDNQIIKESREVIFRCRDEGMLRAKVRWTRPGGRALPVGARDKDGRLEIPNIRLEDAGTYICEAVGYPRHVSGQQKSVLLNVEKYNPRDERLPTACSATQATCMNAECIDKSQICDGIPHCSDGSDEHSCSHGRKCHPNQFMCRNSKCVDRVWRCDGENDCGDMSDEESCDPEPSGAPCRYDEFQCRSGHCIPKSFQCDDTNDCRDGSDEIGCMAPDKIRDPPPTANLQEGESLNLTCKGVGTPVPVIVWRLNWGHVPDKCISKTYFGEGSLYCPDMQVGDSGAYSCEIINSKGNKFATDTLVTVTGPVRPGVCPAGFFNMLARRADECINCFCFGVTKSCKSADLYNYAIAAAITSHRVVDVELSPYSNIVISEAISKDIMSLRHGVQFRANNVMYGSRSSSPYLALPGDYLGNQLKSYGGALKYDVSFMGLGRPTPASDVIITGNGFTLTHRSRVQPQVNIINKMNIQFAPGQWKKPDGRIATREEIMMILANVDNILIRLSYIDATERQVELTNILMNSAGVIDQGLGQASLIEQCACPMGYIGDSCETCAPGYVRQPGGPWLGRCVPYMPQPCSDGTYGDPRRGIPCRECPCPHSGANNFASGCSLGADNEVTCNCNEGYTGRRCEICAPGYQGNPLAPGGRCVPKPDDMCNAEGTYSANPNGTCTCKPLVTGPRCDTCKPDSFHLNSFTYTGCIECFCSGLPTSCSSSSWYRDQVSSSIGRSSAPHGFELIENYNTEHPGRVQFIQKDNVLSFNEPRTSETLYWRLPTQFLGNKITAYGGKLNYTVSYTAMPGGLMSRSTSPDVVIKSGEDLTIIHYRRSGVSPSSANSYSVPIIENAWQRSDGQPVNRQHLLMALSKIDDIYIKATYTTSTRDGSLTQVAMDIATRNNIGTAKALEVEDCRCPEGYIGLSCERCAPGFKRNPEAGLYLGDCEACECNGHSTQCDSETGVCHDCADNTEGDSCDRCAYGYTGDATQGTPYDCQPTSPDYNPRPPYNNQTCVYCNQDGTEYCDNGYCYCKSNVQGSRCDQCRPGTFGLSSGNPAGCEECYCSGKSTTCRSASLYRQLIPVDFLSNPPQLTFDKGDIADTDYLDFDIEKNEYTYSFTSYTNKYWSLSGSVLGNQLYSYGGVLSYHLNVESYGQLEPGNDVILIGNGMELLWSRPSADYSDDYSIRFHEDENWQKMQSGVMQHATRLDFMNVLSNLEHILIRATPMIPTTRSAISDVILQGAVETPSSDTTQASDIEMCTCPAGYSGSSCESCSTMHYRDSNGNCVACPCQDDSTNSCSLDDRGYVKCQCKSGYSGDRCQYAEGHEMENTTPRPTPVPDYRTQITVSIAPPDITIIPAGGSITLKCSGYLAYNGSPVIVSWYKLNDQMPYGAEQSNGILRMFDLQIHDSGTYICQAKNNETLLTFEDEVSITVTESSRRSPAKIDYLPPSLTVEEYVYNEVNCKVSGNPLPSVIWTRVDGQMSNEARVNGSRLIFEMPRKSDEGSYRCQANNGVGYEEKYTQIYVRVSTAQPTPLPRELIYIEPPSFVGAPGAPVHLTCQPTTSIILKYEWTKDGYPIYGERNLIINSNMLDIRETSPRDSGVYTCIGIDIRGARNYTSDAQVIIEETDKSGDNGGNLPYQPTGNPPVVHPLPEENRIIQGQDFTITCSATGTPYPTIKWTKVHEALGDNVHQSGNVLRIMNARPDNRGIYLCIGENEAGHDRSSTFIDIEPREHPSIDIDPKETQTVTVGGQGVLYCMANGIPQPRVQWQRVDGQPLSRRHQMQGNEPGYIVIDNVMLADAGDYRCTAENEVGTSTGIATIRVIEAPVIEIEPNVEVLTATEGDEVKIRCKASGVPSPSVYWEEDRATTYGIAAASANSNEAFLEFYRVSQQNAKAYKCVAANEAGNDERYIVLDVKPRRGDAPRDSDVDRSPYPTYPTYPLQPRPDSVYRSKPGDNVTLHCNLLSEGVAYRTNWVRVDGQELPSNSQYADNKLIIIHMIEQNAGEYRCSGYDSRGELLASHLAELVYLPIPRITINPNIPASVNTNDNIEFSCDTEGAQPIDVSWHTDNNRPMPQSVSIEGKYLRFVSITPAAAGRYYCLASNQFGNATEMAEVIVNRGHAYEPRPQSKNYEFNEGEKVRLTCEIQEHNVPIRGEIYYTWYREDGQQLPQHSEKYSNALLINGVRSQDEGRYICEPTNNGVRIQPTYFNLHVKPGVRPMPYPYPPPTTTTVRPRYDMMLRVDQQQSNLRVGESTEVECYSSDNSYTDVVWERADGEPLPPHLQQFGNRLVINHVTPADAGRYVCKCKTDEGDLYTTSYELNIEANVHEWKHPKIVHADVGSVAKLQCNSENVSPSYRWSRQYGQMQIGSDILNDQLMLSDVQANDAGTYICTATKPDGESVDYPTILVVTGAIPHFHQDPISYMSFPTLRDPYIKFNFEITFRPEKPNGLLLFNGQKKGNGDYIALSLNDGYPEFHFDFDGKSTIIRAEQQVDLDEWHTIRVNRFRRDGYMQVDDQHPVAFPTLSLSSSLDLVDDLYLGGVPSWDILPKNAIDAQIGFVGCISRLTLQGSIVELMKDAKMKEGITACQPCKTNPCNNGGICLESQTEMAYTCICQQGWTGRNCAIEGTQCTPGICGTGRCENTEIGMECMCPLNKTGDRCQYIEHLNANSLAFKKNSFAAYGTPRASKLNIKFQVRPNTLEDGVLFYAAESKLPSGDFVAVLLHQQHVELIINTGARLKPVVVRSLNPLPLNKWTDIEIARRFGEAILRVGSEPEQKGKAAGAARQLYIKTPMYIGGYDHEKITLNRNVNVTQGFDGCISNLFEGQKQINLIADIDDAANIQNCGEINEIDQNETFNNENNNINNEPLKEDLQTDACASDPCENGGTCYVENEMAVCTCNVGFAGKHCEEHINLQYNANFHGNGYLELNRSQFNENVEQKYSFAAMVFDTTAPNGLLLWWGQHKGESYTGQDFMSLAIVDGIVEFSFRLNGEEAVLRNPDKRVDDGSRHIVLIKRTDNTAILELDHLIYATETRPTGKDTMSLPGHVFIGGAPDLDTLTGSRYKSYFNGCVSVVEGESSGIINLGNVAISGVNVDTCPEVDDNEGTEPPVV